MWVDRYSDGWTERCGIDRSSICAGVLDLPTPHPQDGPHAVQLTLLLAGTHQEGHIEEHVVKLVVAVVEGTGEVLGQLFVPLKQVPHRVQQR